MSRILYFDCFSGAAGDMILGALIDAGLPVDEVREALGSLALGDVRVEVERVSRSGIGATSFRVVEPGSSHPPHSDEAGPQAGHTHPPDHNHDHDPERRHGDGHTHPGREPHHHHHHHRGLREICDMVDGSALSVTARERAKHLFRRLAETEAAIHQMPVEEVHLHEVGAVDSIIDVAGAVFGLERLGVDRVLSSPLNLGSGTVACEHGIMPVPAPATARLVEGVPVYARGPAVELLTPTGALILTDYVDAFGPLPPMRIQRSGYGAGDRDFADHPNVLRVLLGDDGGGAALEPVVVIECEIDDMNPQIFGVLMDRLHAAGALDVYYSPIQMKKNRPGTLVSVVARPETRDTLVSLVFSETTTLGVRFQEMTRERLARTLVPVETPLGTIRFKVARRGTSPRVVNAAPEFEDCARVAQARGLSVKEVQAIATKAYLESTGIDR